MMSQAEEEFVFYLELLTPDLPKPERQFKFHPTRQWQCDFAWPESKVVVEIEGGVYTQGRHVRPSGFIKDIQKYNALMLAGYRLLRFTPDMISDDPMSVLDQVRRMLQVAA